MTMVKRLPNKMLPLTSTLAYTILLLEGVHAFPAAGGGSNGASAQMTFTNLYIDRQDQGAGTCIRPSNSAGPWEIDNGMLTSCGMNLIHLLIDLEIAAVLFDNLC